MPIPLPPPRPLFPHELYPYRSRLDKVRVCLLCEEYYARWQMYKRAHVNQPCLRCGEDAPVCRHTRPRVAPAHLEQAAYLYMMLRAHVLQCRVVAKSLGERTEDERCEEWNRRTRDVQQSEQFRAFRATWRPVEAQG